MTERLRDWAPETVVGVAVLVWGVLEIWAVTIQPYDDASRLDYLLVVVGFAVAAATCRKAPFVGLVLVWVICALQLVFGVGFVSAQLAVAVVAFGCARWGSAFTVVVSGLSIPAAAVVGYVIVNQTRFGAVFRDLSIFREIQDNAYRFSDTLLVGATIFGLLILAVPWLAGLAFRAFARARSSEEKTEQAEADVVRAQVAADQAREIARLQEDQARLARDVHDVVGHSLAVILAQAESGQFLSDEDPAALKKTLATIAGSARSSLQDVRQVLAQEGEAVPARTGAFEELVEGVRAGGHEVRVTDVGQARVMAPELDVAAHRVVQEMLTNAIKHGRKDRPVEVERHWPEGSWDRDLRIEVRNVEMFGNDETQPMNAAGPSRSGHRRDAAATGVGRRSPRRAAPGRGRRADLHRDRMAPGERPMTGDDIRVLLVDDQDLFREGVRVIVDAQPGMGVVGSAADGIEAVRLVDELEPDVVLMDVRMPEMDGVEATRQIFTPERVARRSRPVRVVVLTTFNLDDRAATAIRHGASGFLLKDTTPVQLGEAIRTVHSGNAVLAPADLSTLLDQQFRTAAQPPASYLALTDKEREVFEAVARGLSNTEIAGQVFLSESTVKTHVGAILRKLALRDRVQIVVFAHEHGLVGAA